MYCNYYYYYYCSFVRLHRSRRSLVNHAAPFFVVAFAIVVVTHKYLYFIVNECRLYLYAAHNTRRTIIYLVGMNIELDTRAIVPYKICFIIMIIGKLYARLDAHTVEWCNDTLEHWE